MDPNTALYEFLSNKTWDLTEEWYASIDKANTDGVYASDCPDAISKLKQQNHAFHERFCKIFILPEEEFFPSFEEWIISIAQDEKHLETPSYLITHEFFKTQEQYLRMIDTFVSENKSYTDTDRCAWVDKTLNGFNRVITWFLKEKDEYEEKKIKCQQQTINKLSSPVISLSKQVALLPLIGTIDSERAVFMMEYTLEKCSNEGFRRLLIDMSGVAFIDTMVAHQIFQLIDALSLIGVETTLSGIRPEIAQAAVSFGGRFNAMTIVPTLSKAIDMYL